jgi:hypothetical protein
VRSRSIGAVLAVLVTTAMAGSGQEIFSDGFESGGAGAWSSTFGHPPPSYDTCDAPEVLVEGVEQGPYSTVAATDDYDLACVAVDGPDTVHQIVLGGNAALLVNLSPQSPEWQLASSIRENCAAGPDLACIAGGFPERFINRPNLPAGTYEVIVDGSSSQTGEYTILYHSKAPDTTFGYWVLESTDLYTPLTGATQIPIGTGYPAGDGWAAEITLPFDFDYFGTTYTSGMLITVTDDMYLTFGDYVGDPETYQPDCLDDTEPGEMIAPFWVDGMSYSATAALSYTVDGTGPNRRLTVEWRDFDILEGPWILPTRVNHQVVLFENGDIEFRYGPRVSGPYSYGCGYQEAGCSAAIGIEGGAGASHDADLVDCFQENTQEGRVIRFVHPN